MIRGAFFDPHVMERAKERIGLEDFPEDKFEQKIIDLDGDLYHDKQYENYQIVLDDLVFAFDLRLHDERPGLMAYVKTSLPPQDNFRDREDRFERLRPEDYELSQESEIALKKIVERALRDKQSSAAATGDDC